MLTDELWITARIAETRKNHPLVTEAASSRFCELLKGPLSGRQLTPGELESAAKALIKNMAPASPAVGA